MPCWQDVVEYEEGSPRVHQALRAGYPRFVVNPLVRRLAASLPPQAGMAAWLYPDAATARRAVDFITRRGGKAAWQDRIFTMPLAAVWAGEDEASRKLAKAFWQHFGVGLSSRQAEDALAGSWQDDDAPRAALTHRVAGLAGAGQEHVALYATGMGAIAAAYHLATEGTAKPHTVQLGFPYLDTLKLQQVMGEATLIPYRDGHDKATLEAHLAHHPVAAVFCELPGNPLLQTIDLPWLSGLCRRHGVVLVLDDTLSGWANLSLEGLADMRVTSLTKWFSGTGDVAGGALVIDPESPHADLLQSRLQRMDFPALYGRDAATLLANGADYEQRMQRINQLALLAVEALQQHPDVAEVWHPSTVGTRAEYKALMRPGGGYGGLMSIILKDPAKAPAFYEAMPCAKGPSLGTNFTLACPYTLLAHYEELPWAASLGVSAHLIRLSVGMDGFKINE
jgi:cystathionine gamma-synthase